MAAPLWRRPEVSFVQSADTVPPAMQALAVWRRLSRRSVAWLLLGLIGASLLIGLGGMLGLAFQAPGAVNGEIAANPFSGLIENFGLLWAAPGMPRSLVLTLWVGLGATFLATLGAHGLFCVLYHAKGFAVFHRVAGFLLSAPPLACALAFAFMCSPSGILARWLSPWATQWTTPPDYAFPMDPMGLALMLGLALKELPFLFVVLAASARDLPILAWQKQAQSLGYPPVTAFSFAISPVLARRIRLPVCVALAYALSSVDQALILGPTNPPVLSVRILQWFNDPNPDAHSLLGAGALLLLGLVLLAFALWHVLSFCQAGLLRSLAALGSRRAIWRLSADFGAAMALMGLALLGVGLFMLILSAFGEAWMFPQDFPQAWSLAPFTRAWAISGKAFLNSGALGLISCALALVLTIAALESSQSSPLLLRILDLVMLVPLLIPDTSLMLGLQIFWSRWHLDGGWPALIWAHALYCVPYAWLLLSGPFRGQDPRLAQTAQSLGLTPWASLWRVRLPILLSPLLLTASICFLISFSLFLPTIFATGGRIPTLATEVIALSASGDRRQIGAMALSLILVPIVIFELAHRIPAWCFRNRSGLSPVPLEAKP